MGHKNRSHSKIAKALSPKDRDEINKRLATPGVTYDDIVGWLKGKGYEISRSAVGRYGKDFLSRLERLKEVEQKARAIVAEAGDGLPMEEAVSKVFTEKVLSHLLELDDLTGQKFGSLMAAFAKLQSSSAQRERLKADFKKKAEHAVKDITDKAAKGGLSVEAIKLIEEQILGIVR
ncbi:MAG: DUF3486 family protein [Deltaproteobacteria bacterium]|nr:DUF3486 family protein [Deltaproteobacteria bacterium]